MSRRTVVAFIVIVGTLALFAAGAGAELRRSEASDPRATFIDSNITTCAELGFGAGTIQVSGTASDSDPNVSVVVTGNTGPVQPGVGEEVDVTILGAGVVVDAVVVKGGSAANAYTNPAVLPPALASPQHYISPFNGGGVIPDLSHFVVCYHLTTPPPPGTLTVDKQVILPEGIPASPLPTSFTVIVDCDDGVHIDIPIVLGRAGGRAPTVITDIPDGTTCTVVEQGVGSLPAGTVVTYDPPGADTTGVVIGSGVGVNVDVTNDFSAVAVQVATIQVMKSVVGGAPGGPLGFVGHIECDDGSVVDVPLAATGGPGAPLTVRAGSLCLVEELDTGSLPPGWLVSYSVDGGPPTSLPPIIGPLRGDTVVTVTITNDGSASTTTTAAVPTSGPPPPSTFPDTSSTAAPTSTSSAPPSSTTTSSTPPSSTEPDPDIAGSSETDESDGSSGPLAFTGGTFGATLVLGGALVAAGALLVLARRRMRGA